MQIIGEPPGGPLTRGKLTPSLGPPSPPIGKQTQAPQRRLAEICGQGLATAIADKKVFIMDI